MIKTRKGSFNYIKNEKIKQLVIALLMFAISVILYYAGIKATGSNKNALTYVAILGCLPGAKFMVGFVLFSKAKGCSAELKEKLDKVGFEGYYDLFFTTYKKNYQVSAAYYNKNTLIGITEDEKCDVSECEKHLSDSLKSVGFDITVKIFTDSTKFTDRYTELKELQDDSDSTFLKDNILNLSI